MADAFSEERSRMTLAAAPTHPQGRLRGGQCECAACLLRFGGTRAFELHRTGPATDRRCRSVDALVALGMRVTPRGWSTAYSTSRSRGKREKRAVAA